MVLEVLSQGLCLIRAFEIVGLSARIHRQSLGEAGQMGSSDEVTSTIAGPDLMLPLVTKYFPRAPPPDTIFGYNVSISPPLPSSSDMHPKLNWNLIHSPGQTGIYYTF